MLLLTEREQIRRVAARWRRQYPKDQMTLGRSTTDTWRKLCALDVETAAAADVDAIIGTTGWVTKTKCHECGTKSWDIINIGQPGDYEDDHTANLCKACLLKGASLL